VREAGERPIGERDERVHAQPRVVVDPDEVEVIVIRILRRAHHRAVRPGLDQVTEAGVPAVVPGTRTVDRPGIHTPTGGHVASIWRTDARTATTPPLASAIAR
jgi:hypothetical protein